MRTRQSNSEYVSLFLPLLLNLTIDLFICRLLTAPNGNPIDAWKKSLIFRIRGVFLGLTSFVPMKSLITHIAKNTVCRI